LILVAVVVAVGAAIAAWYLSMVGWALRKKPLVGAESLVGKHGVAITDFESGVGEVNIDGINWRARAAGSSPTISKGDSILVVGLSALILEVRKEIER
jgi:membrane-bound ClpP family serine protease